MPIQAILRQRDVVEIHQFDPDLYGSYDVKCSSFRI
jgi:hypothetical protein